MKCLYIVALISVLAGQQSGAQTVTAEQEVLKVENDWNQALVRRDMASLPRFYADEYLYTDPDGLVWDRTQDLANLTSGSAARLSTYKLDDTKVRIVGDVAIVTGRNTINGVFERVRRAQAKSAFGASKFDMTGSGIDRLRKPYSV